MTAANEEIILITRADDFGYSHSGNVGILDSLRFGIIRSAGHPDHRPWFEEAAQMALAAGIPVFNSRFSAVAKVRTRDLFRGE